MTSTAVEPSRKTVSFPVLALTVPWIAVVIASFRQITDNSYLWHIAAGHLQREASEVLTTDPFSFTMRGEPWLTQSWLAEILYSWAETSFGIGFTGVMLFVVTTVTLIGIAALAFRHSRSQLTMALVVLLSTVLFTQFLVPRPALFSYPLFVLVILAWERPATRWTVPFLMWVWASVHGSFAIGLVYLLLVMIARRDRKALPHLLAAGVATILTAHGVGVVTTLLEFATAGPYLDLISEWATPDFLTPGLLPFLAGIVILLYGSMRQRLATSALWVIVPFLALGFSATRAVVTAFIGLTPFVAEAGRGASWRRGGGFPTPVAAVVTVVVLTLPFLFAEPVILDPERFPVVAAMALENVRTFHDDRAGGYLIYSGDLDDGVYIDDRAELYRGRITEFVELRAGVEDWETAFARDGITQALLRAHEPMIGWLVEAGWAIVHEDPEFVVLRPA